jgi:5,6,7,8-tetrahydromethanopterin hydro-lyase
VNPAFVTQIGEGFVGAGPDAAHVNTVLGAIGGPVETAWASALAQPSPGHTPFMVVAQPGLAVKPLTLFVNKATIASERHGELTWGSAQAGVAAGVQRAIRDRIIDATRVDDLLLIVAVWVNPAAADAAAVFANNRDAMVDALRAGLRREPRLGTFVEAEIWNPYFDPR